MASISNYFMLPQLSPVSVVLPAYNEADSIAGEIAKIQAVLAKAEIAFEFIVVDDGSEDSTGAVAESCGVRLIRHKKNRGVGAARKTGILSAKNEIIITTDADGTYPADPIPELVKKVQVEGMEMAIGARTKESGASRLLRLPAKFFIRKLACYLAREEIPDLNSGLRVFKRSAALKYFYLLPDSHSWESTITLAFLCNHQNVCFLPIDYFKRTGGKSSFHPIKDTYNYISLVIRTVMYFNPLRIFLPLGLLVLVLGISKTVYDWIVHKWIGGLDVMIMLSSLLIFVAGLLADLMVVLHRKSDPSPN